MCQVRHLYNTSCPAANPEWTITPIVMRLVFLRRPISLEHDEQVPGAGRRQRLIRLGAIDFAAPDRLLVSVREVFGECIERDDILGEQLLIELLMPAPVFVPVAAGPEPIRRLSRGRS